ncbi:MAG: hypothetical protein ACJASR_002619, partial [Psychroserpens sp.]
VYCHLPFTTNKGEKFVADIYRNLLYQIIFTFD